MVPARVAADGVNPDTVEQWTWTAWKSSSGATPPVISPSHTTQTDSTPANAVGASGVCGGRYELTVCAVTDPSDWTPSTTAGVPVGSLTMRVPPSIDVLLS